MRALLAALLLVSGCAASYPTPPYPSPQDGMDLPGFARVDVGVYRFSQPTDAQICELAHRFGVTDIFKLDHWYEGADHPVCGVTIHDFALDPLTVTWDEFDRAYRAIKAAHDTGKVIGWHCKIGRDRTGAMQFAWDVDHGVPVDAAYAHMMRMGFHPYAGLWAVVSRIAGWK